jgi:hypothetical protein
MSATSAWRWRPFEELPEPGNRPGRMFVRVEGWKTHSGATWYRMHCDLVCSRIGNRWCIRQEDIDRIMRDGDMDGIDRITHWMVAQFPAVDGEA